jgi:Flp pilus assembly protein TadD
MRLGGTLLIAAAVLAAGACTEAGKLEIRAIASPLAAGNKPVSFRIAEARGHFVLGNVALALESFRKAAREDPASVDALSGMAACYDRMGRFDLSRRNYEAALALAPGDPALLTAFAASLDLQQLGSEAARVRAEIRTRLAAATAIPETQAFAHASAEPVSATAALMPILPTTVADAVAAVLAAPDWRRKAPSVSARPATRQATADAPRIERLSLGEVALITGAGPQWRVPQAQPIVRKPLTGAAAIRHAAAAPKGIRLFNAARVDKLASRARSYLADRGWTVASVGDVILPRSRSVILYPSDKRVTAARLSAQFGFAMEQRTNLRQVTILLGSDAAVLPMLQPSSG